MDNAGKMAGLPLPALHAVMTEPPDPREPTPYMRRLAASMSRSTDTLRTLPGRLSRSLAPSRRGKRRIWRDLQLLALALLPFVIAAVVMFSRGGHGSWVIVQASAPPWQADAQVDPRIRELIGEAVVFERKRVRAPGVFGCHDADYEQLELPPEGVFQGVLAAQGDAAGWSARLGLDAAQIDTLRVDCGNASVDYHRAGNVLMTLVDGSIVRLARR